jgi:hypothetical protein
VPANRVGPPLAQGGTPLEARVRQDFSLGRPRWCRGENHGIRVAIGWHFVSKSLAVCQGQR